MSFFVGFKYFIEVIKRLGGFHAFFFKEIFAQNQAAVVERLVIYCWQVITFSIAELQPFDIVFQAKFLYTGVEVGCPLSVVADGDNGPVECQGGVGTACA